MRKNFRIIALILILAVIIIAVTVTVQYYRNLQKLPENTTPVSFSDLDKPQQPVQPILYSKLWGAYTGNTLDSFISFQELVGKRADINAVFSGWGDDFPTSVAVSLKSSKQTLVIFWEQYGVTLDNIISGDSDSYIKQFSAAAKSYGGPVIIVPLHEMNGNWGPWSGTAEGNTPEKVILAFQRIHNVFVEIENQNIKWGWAVNNESVPNTPENQIQNYYPGDSYVDYVGVDGFNFGNPWQSYSEIFSNALAQLKNYNKPILIFSTACASGSRKVVWIKDALSQIQKDPDIQGFIWFNENKEKNWLINSDPASLQAFKEGI